MQSVGRHLQRDGCLFDCDFLFFLDGKEKRSLEKGGRKGMVAGSLSAISSSI